MNKIKEEMKLHSEQPQIKGFAEVYISYLKKELKNLSKEVLIRAKNLRKA